VINRQFRLLFAGQSVSVIGDARREIPPAALSRVTSLDWFTTTGLMPIGFALVAPAAQLLGTRTTMLVSSLIVLALFLGALAAGDVRRLTAP
jgi:hypothetical protein